VVAEYKKFCESCGGKVAFPQEFLGKQVNCPHCGVATLLADPTTAANVSYQVPVNPAAPASAIEGEKASFWQRLKGTIELVAALVAIGGLCYAGYQYFKPSEEKLSAEEQYVLAHQYLEGNGTDKNVKRGGELLELAAEKGHVKSMGRIGHVCQGRQGWPEEGLWGGTQMV
jgi:TPR repeat protein